MGALMSRFDAGGFAIVFRILPEFTLFRYENRRRGEKMTAAEIYKSMDVCMEENKGKNYEKVLPKIRAHAAELGKSVGMTEDDILSFYFKMRDLGEHWSE